MKAVLNKLFEHQTLDYDEAKRIVTEIGEGKHNTSQIASFLTVFSMRSVTVAELTGFRDAMFDLCLEVDLGQDNAIDIVGTGGDGKDTFNISTLSSFVVAGAGIKVTKHGNYGVSSSCGSSNVLEHLGVEFSNDVDKLRKQLETSGFCMLHAPLFHPAMRHVGPIRKELQVRTFFNMLGPMINPSSPKNQFLGVFDLSLGRLYGYLYQQSKANYRILHAMDGYDEISLTGAVKVVGNHGEKLLEPQDFGFEKVNPSEIYGGSSVEASAKIFTDVLEGKGTEAQQNVVLANAGMAIQCINGGSLADGIASARESLESGNALQVLKKLTA